MMIMKKMKMKKSMNTVAISMTMRRRCKFAFANVFNCFVAVVVDDDDGV